MGGSLGLFDLVILIIALVLIFRLRAALGRGTPYPRRPRSSAGGQKSIRLAGLAGRADTVAAIAPEAQDGLEQIARRDKSFTPQRFAPGALKAYAMIVRAFAESEKPVLRRLLTPSLYKVFAAALDQRAREEGVSRFGGLRFLAMEIRAAEISGDEAQIWVHFRSRQKRWREDSEKRILDGHPNTAEEVNDLWCFSRVLTSANPAWLLSASAAGQNPEKLE